MKKIISVILIALTTNIFAQNTNELVFPISSETKYKEFVPFLILRSGLRSSAKVMYTEKAVYQGREAENECVLLFDNRSCHHPKFNLLKKQDSIQYVSDGYLLYTIFHKTKEIIINEDSILEKGLALMKENPFAYFYTLPFYLNFDIRKKTKVSFFSNAEFIVINYPRKQWILYRGGNYSYKFRANDFALSELNCFLPNKNNIADVYAAALISLEDENKFQFTKKDFDASQWLDNYTVIDKRLQKAAK